MGAFKGPRAVNDKLVQQLSHIVWCFSSLWLPQRYWNNPPEGTPPDTVFSYVILSSLGLYSAYAPSNNGFAIWNIIDHTLYGIICLVAVIRTHSAWRKLMLKRRWCLGGACQHMRISWGVKCSPEGHKVAVTGLRLMAHLSVGESCTNWPNTPSLFMVSFSYQTVVKPHTWRKL